MPNVRPVITNYKFSHPTHFVGILVPFFLLVRKVTLGSFHVIVSGVFIPQCRYRIGGMTTDDGGRSRGHYYRTSRPTRPPVLLELVVRGCPSFSRVHGSWRFDEFCFSYQGSFCALYYSGGSGVVMAGWLEG